MDLCGCFAVLLVAAGLSVCQGGGQDSTVVQGAFGARVVNAVVDRIRSRCIFSEDRLFLRRVAYVMSRDGAQTATYRTGFDGGIWQVTETMFQATQACNSTLLRAACNNAFSALGIDWPRVTWSDLRKPLYSGVAAALHTLLTLGSQRMPGSVAAQANLSVRMYGGQNEKFSNVAGQATAVVCEEKLDLVFILDSSGSVSRSDFKLMLKFAADVVDVMDVSPDGVRIADIVYSNSVTVHFDFDDYTTKDQVKSHLLTTNKISSGTNTAAGLAQAADTLYDAASGARQDAKNVAVLVTDGRSNSFAATVKAAEDLKDKGTTVFAIGVGNYNLNELKAVASDPICSHVLTLTSFDHIQAIITEIQKSACEANIKFTEDKPITGELPEEGSEGTAETKVPDSNKTMEAVVSCGILHIYVSTTDPKPGPAVFDARYTASPSAPAVLTSTESLPQGTTVYVTVVGTRLPASAAALIGCSNYYWTLGVVPKRDVTVICEVNGAREPCTNVINAGLCQQKDDVDYPIDNPCTPESLEKGVTRHSYPYDPTKFLQCDLQGRYYVTSCPGDVIFNTQSLECGFTSPGAASTGGAQEANGGSPGGRNQTSSSYVPPAPLPGTVGNPCTAQAVFRKQFYHKYDSDNTKFIQCDEWGKAWVMPCGPSTQWSQDHYSCVEASTSSSGPVTCSAGDTYLVDPCDHHQYYRCVHQQATRVECYPSYLFYDPATKACGWTDTNPAAIPASCSSG